MLSPRTVSLRIKSRALIKAFDSRAAIVCQKQNCQICLNGQHHERFESHENRQCIDVRTQLAEKRQNILMPPTACDTNTSSLGEKRNSSSSETDETNEERSEKLYHHLQEDVDEFICLHNSHKSKTTCSDFSSGKCKFVGQHNSLTQDSSPRKSRIQVHTNKLRNQRTKSVSLEQQRAANAQMHAFTYSHCTSKCYCTDYNNVRVKPDKNYVVQIYGRKQHIPDRLKRKRYRALSIPKPSRSVRWTDNDEESTLAAPSAKIMSLPRTCKSSSKLLQTYSSNCLAQGDSESHINLLDKVKTFRESHWSDCHASRDGSTSSDHNCAFHYVLNERLFLQPVHKNHSGEDSCPVCFFPTTRKQVQHIPPGPSNLKVNASTSLRYHMVTLPKSLFQSESGSAKGNVAPKSSLQFTKVGACTPTQRPCFHVAHQKQMEAKAYFSPPTDSLALRYLKKC